jgi:hypothetical protein
VVGGLSGEGLNGEGKGVGRGGGELHSRRKGEGEGVAKADVLHWVANTPGE